MSPVSTDTTSRSHYDVVVVGGGHNGLVAAAYLARAGLSTLVLERLDHTGGAAVSAQAFRGHPVRLSRYSYLVSVMPDALMADLDLDVTLVSRRTASHTPTLRGGVPGGLHVERPEGARTRESFAALTGGEEEYAAWQRFYAEVGTLAEALAPTFLQPLPSEADLRDRVDPTVWRDLVERPLGEAVERRFRDDTVRGVVATDALIGTFASLHDPSLVQNRCFLYHLVGNGTGLAGLRAHIKARIDAGMFENWLVFGERNAEHDFLCRDELQGWVEAGQLARLDLAFSRDGAGLRYVQHLLAERGEELRAWIARGAAVYVCGSLQGMAGGVHEALANALGAQALDELAATGCYRRDVY